MPHTPSHNPSEPTPATGAVTERRWTLHAVTGAVALASALTAGNAWALALGRVSVQSLLGEPLRAEIDLPSLTEDEAASLRIGVAPLEHFRSASMEYNPLLGDVGFELVKRSDGRSTVRLRSSRIVNDPFLDLVVQAQWANGQLLRGYTLLFDPPNLRPASPPPLLPAASAPVAPRPAPVPPTASPAPAPRPVAPSPAASAPPASRVTVARGDTAGRIAATYKPTQASLEQMLLGLLRANPQAFVGQNVNRLKAGVVLDLPDADAVTAISPNEARRLITAQSRDFNDYRRRLAAAAPTQAPTERAATGTVQTEVSEARPAEKTPDKLTLSKAGAARGGSEEQIAQTRQQADSKARAGELSRNLEELEQLRASTAPAVQSPAPAPASAPTEGAVPALPTGAPTPAPEPAPAPPPAPAAPPPPVAPSPPAPAAASPLGFLNDLMAHPLAVPAAGGLAALLGVLALVRLRRRKASEPPPQADAEDSSYAGAAGQSVDTSEDAPVSSMMYSPSQLDAGGDVDPVAEADVYLAYGRDKQAEEILVEALRLHPDRLPVRAKLLEIYAQRNDVAAYNEGAQALYDLTFGEGPEWAQARDTGLTLDPENPLYLHGAAPSTEPLPPADPATAAATVDLAFDTPDTAPEPLPALDLPVMAPTADTPAPTPVEAEPPADGGIDFDFDLTTPTPAAAPEAALDFDLDLTDATAAGTPEATPAADEVPSFDLDLTAVDPGPAPTPVNTEAPAPRATDDLGFDFDVSEAPVAAPASELPADVRDLSLDLDLELDRPDAAAPASDNPLADFDDLSSLEVDEGGSADPLETKLSLAREFEAIGDTDGARSLAEEVEAEASGDLQARARAFLAQLA